jgi:hypothetical protein
VSALVTRACQRRDQMLREALKRFYLGGKSEGRMKLKANKDLNF